MPIASKESVPWRMHSGESAAASGYSLVALMVLNAATGLQRVEAVSHCLHLGLSVSESTAPRLRTLASLFAQPPHVMSETIDAGWL